MLPSDLGQMQNTLLKDGSEKRIKR